MNASEAASREWSEFLSTSGRAANGHDKTEPTRPFFRHAWELVAEKRETTWLLHKILEASVLAVLAGPAAVSSRSWPSTG